MAEKSINPTRAGHLLLRLLVAFVVLSVSEASSCSWGNWTAGCGANCLQQRACICDGGNSSMNTDCVGPASRSCCTAGTPSQTTLVPTQATTAPATLTTTISMTTKQNLGIATDLASGSGKGGSNTKTLIAVIAPIGIIVFIAVLTGLLIVIWKKRKNSVITVTRPIPEEKRRKFQKVSEPDSPV